MVLTKDAPAGAGEISARLNPRVAVNAQELGGYTFKLGAEVVYTKDAVGPQGGPFTLTLGKKLGTLYTKGTLVSGSDGYGDLSGAQEIGDLCAYAGVPVAGAGSPVVQYLWSNTATAAGTTLAAAAGPGSLRPTRSRRCS